MLYPVLQRVSSILEAKKQTNYRKSNRARSADAVRAIFHPPEKETKKIQLDHLVFCTQRIQNYKLYTHP